MATIKSYTDIEQSKKLAGILPFESADMYIYKNIFFGALSCFNGAIQVGEYVKLTDKENEAYPCWSLATLLDVLPNGIVMNKDSQNGKYHFSSMYIGTYVTADNPVDACYEMIIKLKELNLL